MKDQGSHDSWKRELEASDVEVRATKARVTSVVRHTRRTGMDSPNPVAATLDQAQAKEAS